MVAFLLRHTGVSLWLARGAQGVAGARPLRGEPEESAPRRTKAENLTGLTRQARGNGALRYRLEAGSLDTLGE